MPLAKSAFYFPIRRGLYEVAPGLHPLGFDFGNGLADTRILQFDEDFPRYRSEKIAARKDDLTKYFGLSRLSPEVEKAVTERLLAIMTSEWPEYFQLQTLTNGDRKLTCLLTGESLSFNAAAKLTEVTGSNVSPPYQHSLDALFFQLQEDGAVVSTEGEDNWLSAVHVTLPSHWDPREKLGRDFIAVHAPVPGFERMARTHRQIIDAMVNKGPFVRFVWSFVTDTRLNHHPVVPAGENKATWKGRSFDDSDSQRAPFSLRIERQVTLGLPEVGASLFFIRLSFIDGAQIRDDAEMRGQLISALKSMTPESRRYKGVEACFDRLIGWLA